ncbi:hypothetical protein DNHGIG_05880 [Collibacillus ludicampi]|jgi:hypothetical protein|uniref:Uncharacterized protein n=1 Tax=Collibacillus ludicampi TaxID=2771369 RepID=A0AAV4LBG5_9BACL|nr:hypothetical protein [Collibacillus ludicampi]GIM45039.1 hypothetical protein DNHGIG_05880 [Collibacillus ludicampi]
MKMEAIQEQLKEWGELIITTDAGDSYEIHLGDTKFDMTSRVITISTPEAEYILDGDSIESIKKHYSHKMEQ